MGRPPRWREAVAVAALMTYPAILNLEEAGRVDSPDGRWAIWNVAWVAHALTTDPAGLYQTNIFHPYSDTLVFAEANLVAGLLAVPAYLATGSSFVAHNSVLLIAFMLSFIGMYALARSLTDSPAASIAPAIAFACCPYIFARVPHISLQLMGGSVVASGPASTGGPANDWTRGHAGWSAGHPGASHRLLRHLRWTERRARCPVLRDHARAVARTRVLGHLRGCRCRRDPPRLAIFLAIYRATT